MNRSILLVTGGLGFIGKHFVQYALEEGHYVSNIDSVTYAADRIAMKEFEAHPRYQFTKCKTEELEYLPECDYIVNFAAESHVDNSIVNNSRFCSSNILGVQRILELLREKRKEVRPKLIHISTDEVYGPSLEKNSFETSPLKPSSPYSATKAAADMLVIGWGNTYDIGYLIIRPSNTYGYHQHPEKLIGRTCFQLKQNKLPIVHGDGSYKRVWLHVDDLIKGIFLVMPEKESSIWNIGGDYELTNLQLIAKICDALDVECDILFVDNRIGQDYAYGINSIKIKKLGWEPIKRFHKEIIKIASQYDIKRFIQPWSHEGFKKT